MIGRRPKLKKKNKKQRKKSKFNLSPNCAKRLTMSFSVRMCAWHVNKSLNSKEYEMVALDPSWENARTVG